MVSWCPICHQLLAKQLDAEVWWPRRRFIGGQRLIGSISLEASATHGPSSARPYDSWSRF